MFRLLDARLAKSTNKHHWLDNNPPTMSTMPEISFREAANEATKSDNNSHVSVLLGRNGEGKSRILSGIATTFQLLQAYARGGTPRGLPLSRLEYLAGGRHHLIHCTDLEIRLRIDGVEAPLEKITLPRRVIGLSMTPFDKFPIGSEKRSLDLTDPEAQNVYAYFGMRERMGRVSSAALLTRAIEGMVSRITLDDRSRLTNVFEMLGFVPALDIVYRFHQTNIMEGLAEGRAIDDLLDQRINISFFRDRLKYHLASSENALFDLQKAAREALSKAVNKYVPLKFDLDDPDPSALRFYDQLQLLRRFGIIRLYAVEVDRYRGGRIDLKEASSGELSIAITFMSLAAGLENDSLILIDEPETNLHPEWQARYLDLLLSTFDSYRNCHYIIATHSPLILSDAPLNATLASLSNVSLKDGIDVSGRPVDYLLVEAFNVVSSDNYYVQEQLIKALRLAADGKARSSEYQRTVRTLIRIRDMISDESGIAELITDLERIAQKAEDR